MEPIFQTNLFGIKTKVYSNRVEYLEFFRKITIPNSQIASIDSLILGVQAKIIVRLRDKSKLIDFIKSNL